MVLFVLNFTLPFVNLEKIISVGLGTLMNERVKTVLPTAFISSKKRKCSLDHHRKGLFKLTITVS